MSTSNLYTRGDKIFGYANAFLLGLFVLSTLYPFIYILSASVSSGAAVTSGRVVLWPVDLTLAAYERVLSDRMFWISYGNTFIYTFGGTAMSLLIMVPGAYALSRKRLRGRTFFNLMIAFTLWFNAGMIPFFLNMRDLGLLDSRFGIIIGFACNAFNVILLRNFFEAVPKSFEEAAKMDGASELQLLWKVFIPLSKPAIVTVALFCIVSRWNGYFWSMVLLRGEEKIPLQVYLKRIIVDLNSNDEFASSLLTAQYSFETITAAIMVASIIPVLIIYPYAQKYFSKGILLGGVKE
ncbi:sugar ABC transporter permease [Devosia geojensis]|uniref:Sugar ABC transporter permease n=1 Tax=Devosia geojensis TaxID=443610 RepID=A0A0F5FT31_9HYPH|nr:carbohydrate ABC transporter permease [Devosia geojensis]KKB11342.1 sugar ABC transporter permease [Devosia geojensis]